MTPVKSELRQVVWDHILRACDAKGYVDPREIEAALGFRSEGLSYLFRMFTDLGFLKKERKGNGTTAVICRLGDRGRELDDIALRATGRAIDGVYAIPSVESKKAERKPSPPRERKKNTAAPVAGWTRGGGEDEIRMEHEPKAFGYSIVECAKCGEKVVIGDKVRGESVGATVTHDGRVVCWRCNGTAKKRSTENRGLVSPVDENGATELSDLRVRLPSRSG